MNTYLYANASPARWIDPLGLDRDIPGALAANDQRNIADQDKIMAAFLGDKAAYDNAIERVNEAIQRYDAAMRGESNRGAPPPSPRITPTPPKIDPGLGGPIPTLHYDGS
jgi:hypothetical protein